jgi:hypothetical protein
MPRASIAEIDAFLQEFKLHARKNKLYGEDRREYKQDLIELSLTVKQRNNIILSLEISNYIDGPKPDRDRAGEIWEFGILLDGVEIYIKLKLVAYQPAGEKELVFRSKCISLHKAKYPLSFPYHKEERKRS